MIYDFAILGGGPAGITAGIYSVRQGMSSVLITKSFGGQMAQKAVDIENYPGFEKISGFDFIQKLENQLKVRGIPVKSEKAMEIIQENNIFKIILESGEIIEAKSAVVAAGSEPRALDVPGEKEFIGRGVSYCTTCDGPLFQGKDIAVIGGGNAGFEAAIFMANYANNIYILEFAEQAKANEDNQKRASQFEKIKVITSAQLKEIKGERFVNEIIYFDKIGNQDKSLKVEGVFAQIGYYPASHIAKNLVDLNEKGEIIVDHKTTETKTAGLFAAGDITDSFLKQVVVAAADGAKSAMAAYKYLQKQNG
ncbi:MAG: FAD-dependent oxidoreductase [Candidatus Paceibacterota bacterium]